MQILPGLWATAEKAEDGNPFKSSIMVTFKSLVEVRCTLCMNAIRHLPCTDANCVETLQALETDSHVLHDAVCHFVQMSCDPTSVSWSRIPGTWGGL